MPPSPIPTNRTRFVILATVLLSLLAGVMPPALFGDEPRDSSIRFLLTWGSRGKAPGKFDFPIGILVDRDGAICVTDFYNARLQRFSADGKYLSSFSVLPNPGGIAADRDGNLYFTHFSAMKLKEERKPDQVSVYSRKGELLRQWGKTGTGDGELDYPGGIAVGPNDRVYVADQTNRRVQVFDTRGKFLTKWGEYGTKQGQFGGDISPKSRVGGPQFVAVDRDGNVYTTEGSMCRIQKFTPDGKFLLSWGEDSDKPGGFGGGWLGGKLRGPVGLCFDGDGNLWVSSVSGRIQQYSAAGHFLRGLTEEPGTGPRQFSAPHGVAVDRQQNLYVVDSHNHRIQKFATARD